MYIRSGLTWDPEISARNLIVFLQKKKTLYIKGIKSVQKWTCEEMVLVDWAPMASRISK